MLFFTKMLPLWEIARNVLAPQSRLKKSISRPRFSRKNAEFDTTSYCKNVSWVKKVRKTKIFFLSKSLHTGPSDTVLTSFFPYLKRYINFPNYWPYYLTNYSFHGGYLFIWMGPGILGRKVLKIGCKTAKIKA